MRRILIGCLAATAVLLLSQQQASAWCNFNFSTGVNTSWQSGGCRLLWGLVETAPGPNSSFGHCAPQGQPQCPPQHGRHMRNVFNNLFHGHYSQYEPYGGDWGNYGFSNYPPECYYQYPQQGYYQPHSAEQPAVGIK